MAHDFFSVHELENTKFDVMEFKGKWLESFGRPEKAGAWIISGESSQGKTNLCFQIAKYMSQFVKHKILINSMEEGKTESFKLTTERSGIATVGNKILFGNRVPIVKIQERLRKQRSPEIVFLDSIQHSDLNKRNYNELKEEFFNKKLFVFVSHADGNKPKGSLAQFIWFDAMIKTRVEGFKAFVESRFGGGEPYIINTKLAAKYHAEVE